MDNYRSVLKRRILSPEINISSPNTRIGLGILLPIRSITIVARSDALFWAPSDAGVCLRAKTKYILEFWCSCPSEWPIIQQISPICHSIAQTLVGSDLLMEPEEAEKVCLGAVVAMKSKTSS
jgi:hypothetical protein